MEKDDKIDSVNNGIYDLYGDRWYTAQDDPVALLRAESRVKSEWILDQLKRHHLLGAKILDVGCGAGFLSNKLAVHGHQVFGVDLSATSLQVAKKYDSTRSVVYQMADAYHLPFANSSFDMVTALDFLEHVEEPQKAIQEFSRVLKPGGLFIFHTFNRNWLAGIVIIQLVEWLVKNTPKHMHVLRLFIKPQELESYCKAADMTVLKIEGIRPVISSLTLSSLFTGIVPAGLRFKMTKSLLLSYLGFAVKVCK